MIPSTSNYEEIAGVESEVLGGGQRRAVHGLVLTEDVDLITASCQLCKVSRQPHGVVFRPYLSALT